MGLVQAGKIRPVMRPLQRESGVRWDPGCHHSPVKEIEINAGRGKLVTVTFRDLLDVVTMRGGDLQDHAYMVLCWAMW